MLFNEEEEVSVHKSLLSERSKLLEKDVDNMADQYLDWERFGLNLQAASQYVGFLYGQPMWSYASGANFNDDWLALNEIHEFSVDYEDFDAADACVDGMRDDLQGWRNEMDHPFDDVNFAAVDFGAPCGRLIVDYMVHRSCDVRRWINAYEDVIEGDDGPADLEQALSKAFAEEVQRKKRKIGKPDLTERCRYHLHVEKGLPCYLDK
jgi:hypothetical protein